MLVLLFCGSINAQNRPRQFMDISFVTINEFTSNVGLSGTAVQYAHSMVGFTTIEGIQLNRHTILGIGTGISFYNGGSLVPLFGDIRFNYYNYKKYTAYFYGDGGFLFKISNKIEYSKLFLNPGIGLQYDLSRSLAGTFGLGLFVQQGQWRDSFINLKLGISFLPLRLLHKLPF